MTINFVIKVNDIYVKNVIAKTTGYEYRIINA